MPPEMAEVRCWLEKAAHDRETADAALARNAALTDTAAYHAQQAVEKVLKAYLAWKEDPFEKIHDLRTLIEKCGRHDRAFLDHREAVEPLTAYAVRIRYPGNADPSRDQADAALATADAIRQFVLSRLPPQARSEPLES